MASASKKNTCRQKTDTLQLSEFMPQAYDELRQIAGHLFKSEAPGRTLQPTALVHEAFIRLAESGPRQYANRAHFFAVAAKTMRRILVEEARRRHAIKRGGGWERTTLDQVGSPSPESPNYLAVDKALTKLTASTRRWPSLQSSGFSPAERFERWRAICNWAKAPPATGGAWPKPGCGAKFNRPKGNKRIAGATR